MAFAATLIRREASGVFIRELYSFTELATDTGGSFGTGLATILGVLVSEGASATATAIRASASGSTVTVANVAGPTTGTVEVIGY